MKRLEDVEYIIVHCSDSAIEAHDDISIVRGWHLDRGFLDVAYHCFIQSNGNVQEGRSLSVWGAGARGYNDRSLHICLHGKTKFTFEQGISLAVLVERLKKQYPNAKVIPHNEINPNKTCPNFHHDHLFKGDSSVEDSIE